MLLKYFIIFCAFFGAISCTKMGGSQGAHSPHAAASPFTMPTNAYLAMAHNQVGAEQQNLLLMAAARSLYDGHWHKAERILAQTTELSPIQTQQKWILSAKIDSMRDKPQKALAFIAKVQDASQLPSYYQLQYHEILASTYEATHQPSHAIAERMKLEPLWQNARDRDNNRRLLWLNLVRLPEAEINTMAIEAEEGSLLQGWMQLALIARQSDKEADLLTRVLQWQQLFPNHAGNAVLPESLEAIKASLHKTPSHIALLVPLQGTLAGPGNAVKDGFMAAYEAANNKNIQISVYDTTTGDAQALYQKALEEGADYVVGPLSKNETAAVARLEHPVPTLLLNDLNEPMDQNTYRFGLSPSNEARQVAVKVAKKGLHRALVIAPSGAWGDDILAAFNGQFSEAGGQVVERLAYDNSTNLNEAIRDFLHVSEKEARSKQLHATPGDTVVAAPKRRQDFDMIFLLAYPSKARQIMPLLKYYFAADVPVFATSSVYAGVTNTMQDRDLDGITFCDMPWMFKNPKNTRKNWPEQLNSYDRLYAIGQDSYILSKKLNQLLLFPAMDMNEDVGVLYLNKAQRIARVLAWGRFSGGVARPLQTVT